MKRIVLGLSLLSLLSLGATAQGRLDLSSQAALRRVKMAEKTLPQKSRIKMLQSKKDFPVAQQPMLALVKLQDGETADALSRDGFEVKGLRGGFAVVTCSPEDASRLAEHKSVKKCEFNRRRSFCMDKAREVSGVNTLHTGIDLPQTFTGKGVVAGIVDGGFDPNHINFKDAEGNSRFKYFATVDVNASGTGVRVTPYTTEGLANFTTDDNTETHGTHTLGIMAGSYMGEALVGTYDKATDKSSCGQANNPYYGVAYNSTLYASSGSSYDALIAYAVDGILEHRWYNDHYAPVVINISLGGNQGPHDGSGALTQYLDAVAESDGAIFCVASGNEGDLPISYNKTFTADDNSFATFIRPFVYTDMRYGMVELYSNSAEDFEVSIIIYNKSRNKIARTFPLNNKEGQIQYICSDASYQQNESDIIDATFAKAYNGYVGIGGMLDPESGRFCVAIDYYVVNSNENPADDETTEAQYTLGFMVTGKDGQRIDCFCDGGYTALDSYGYDGYVNGMYNGSVSDTSTGHNSIVVGAYNTKEWAGSIYGQAIGYDGYYKEGEVTEYSSYATLVDGRNLPHLVAPGNLIVSSMSTPYIKNPANQVSDQITSAKYNDGKRDNYFYPMMGTSMASPFVAGTVALMLEADPTLTLDRIREILMKTATLDDAVEKISDPVQIGAGKLNSLAALKEVLNQSADVKDVTNPDNRLLFTPTGHRSFNVYLAGATKMNVALHSMSGMNVLNATANGNEVGIDASSLAPGVYVLTVNGGNPQKIMIK